MREPEFDRDGYPTKDTLTVVRVWTPEDGYENLLAYVQRAWSYPDYFVQSKTRRRQWPRGPLTRIYHVSTGGWSGNEDLIRALQENWMFWTMCWEQSRVGGHYIFRVRELT